jgi:hypothetical protein
MAKRHGKYKLTKRDSAISLADGGNVAGSLTFVAGQTMTGNKQNVKTGDVGTLTEADSGALVSLSGGARTLVLPAVAKTGVNFTIVAGSTHNHIISCSVGEEDKLQGVVFDSGNASTVASALITNKSAVTLGNGTIGDRIECVSDGTNWHTTMFLKDTPTFT